MSCRHTLLRGPNKGSKCSNKPIKDGLYCSRHNISSMSDLPQGLSTSILKTMSLMDLISLKVVDAASRPAIDREIKSRKYSRKDIGLALIQASEKNRYNIANQLVDYGVDDFALQTALEYSIKNDNKSVTRLLQSKKAKYS